MRKYNRLTSTGRLSPTLIRNLVRVNGVWRLDQLRYYTELKISPRRFPRHFITTLDLKFQTKSLIGEKCKHLTFVYNGRLYPHSGAVVYLVDGLIQVQMFYIQNGQGNLQTVEELSNDLLIKVCQFIDFNLKNYTIYAHNMGKFDGYLILKHIFLKKIFSDPLNYCLTNHVQSLVLIYPEELLSKNVYTFTP